jgi:hypothetical protein
MRHWSDSIAEGREALAQGAGDRGELPDSPVAILLAFLWHEEKEVRQAAVRSLPGGDRQRYHEMHYGYFAEAFLRELAVRRSPAPTQPVERYRVVGEALGELIAQSARDIRAMSGMHYSFLSSALYLALFATCRDAVLAAARLRSAEVQEALCGLLWNLSAVAGVGRMNPQDMLQLMDITGSALAALPPDEIPVFWTALSHSHPTQRRAVSPALRHLSDCRAVPSLLAALPLQEPDVAEQILVCLGRLGDVRALPLLEAFSGSSNRILRQAARNATSSIQRAQKQAPVQTLLRASGPDPSELLRSVGAQPTIEPETLLRPKPVPEFGGDR